MTFQQLIAALDLPGIAQIITALAALAAVYYARQANKAVVEVKADVHKVEVATNSMKDQLVKATEDEALLRGNAEGRAAQTAERKAADESSNERTDQ